MDRLEVKRQLAPDDVASVAALLDQVATATGHAALNDAQSLALAQGGGDGFVAVIATDDGGPVAYAQATRAAKGWELQYASLRPDWPEQVARKAIDVIADDGGGRVYVWVPKATGAADGLASSLGLTPDRDLLQMRRPLPVESPTEPLAVRSFEPGRDEDAWLRVNNRAFAGHPEQSAWDRAMLAARQTQPWFDASGFLLHERDGRLAGFCWTKVHAGTDPVLGEIYVIGVDPDFQGLGLGRGLVVAGLDSLHRRGARVGMLYVDAANAAAVKLYEALGFTVDHIDRAYAGDVPPS